VRRRSDDKPAAGRVGHQRAIRGRTLISLGWTLGILGAVLLFSGSMLIKTLVTGPTDGVAQLPLWLRLLIMLSILTTGGLLYGYSRPLLRRGKQHCSRTITSFDQLTGVRYVLYLRPFTLDPKLASPPPDAPGWLFRSPFELPGLTAEQFLIRQFVHLGRVVAIGQPGERLPLLGAERGYVPVNDWQDTVSEMIRGAHVVLVSAAPGPGTVWEFVEALRTVSPTRLVLLVYDGPAHYDAFRAAAAQEYATRSAKEAAAWSPLPQLPDLPPPPLHTTELRWDFPLKGIVSFDQNWRASFTRFDPAVPRLRWAWSMRRLVRRELEPVLGSLSQLPSAQPLAPSGKSR
jgi:hypothetical protein